MRLATYRATVESTARLGTIVGDVIVGVLGALIGGHVLAWLGIFTYGVLGSLAAAVLGAVILLSLIRVVKRA